MSIEERLEGLGAVPDTPALLVDATYVCTVPAVGLKVDS